MNNDFVIIGCGYWGKNIARVLSELKRDKIFTDNIILYDINRNKSEKLSKLYGFRVAESFKEILSDKKITSVLIITPSSTHYNLAKKALKAGKHVFVEKPFTLNSTEATELVKIADDKELTLMIGLIFRFHHGILELKRRMELGEFGNILFMYGTKFGYTVPKEDSGVVFTLAVNDFDIFCYLLETEYPETILAQNGAFLQKDFEDFTSVSLTFSNGIQGYFIASWLIPVFERHRELYVVGSNKTAVIDYLKPNEIVIYDAKIKKEKIDERILFKMEKNPPQKVVFRFKEPLKEEMKHFIQCVFEKKKPLSDGETGYRAVKMCEMALKSAKNGEKIKVTEELNK
ncbi:MAG: Gfo/Idh/MocA family protein [Promethearchaeota archaeon]